MISHYCKICKAGISENEFNFSIDNYGQPLCRDHQETQKRYNMIKGRIAEALIEELFLSLDYNVFRYGMENTVPGVMKLLKGVRSDVATMIRRMPDFVVQAKNGDVFFVEVKFNASETFSFENVDNNYPFENAFFIIVSKKHIKCLSYKQLAAGEKITPTSHNYLGNIEEFKLDKKVIVDFCDFAVRFFENV